MVFCCRESNASRCSFEFIFFFDLFFSACNAFLSLLDIFVQLFLNSPPTAPVILVPSDSA